MLCFFAVCRFISLRFFAFFCFLPIKAPPRVASFLVGLVVSTKPRPKTIQHNPTQRNTTQHNKQNNKVMHPGLTWDELNTGIDDALRMGRSGKPSQALQKVCRKK